MGIVCKPERCRNPLDVNQPQAEIAELKQRSMYVSSNQTCELCGRNILSTQVGRGRGRRQARGRDMALRHRLRSCSKEFLRRGIGSCASHAG